MHYNEGMVIKFLTERFNDGLSYSAINSARSALSTFLVHEYGLTIGNSSLVKRFMKGVFELRPPKPRYKSIWDVNIVLNYLSVFYPLEGLSLNCLTYKLCMLLALTTMQRAQTIHAIRITNIFIGKDLVMIPIDKLLKQSNQRNYKFSLQLKFYDNLSICVARTLIHYLEITKGIRGDEQQLFISVQKPHKAVSKESISRWIRVVMEEAGIDTDTYKSHSTRAAASSAAKRENYPIDSILEMAGWSNNRTFKRFYDKVILTGTYETM